MNYQDILTYLSAHWTAIASLVGGAAGLSVALEVVLKKLHVNSKKVAFSLLHVFTLLTTLSVYFVGHLKSFDALPVYGSLVIFAETWNRFAISPAYNKIVVPYLEYLEGIKPVKTTVPVVPLGSATDSATPDFSA